MSSAKKKTKPQRVIPLYFLLQMQCARPPLLERKYQPLFKARTACPSPNESPAGGGALDSTTHKPLTAPRTPQGTDRKPENWCPHLSKNKHKGFFSLDQTLTLP